jgi:hypothetical protein
VTSFWCESFAGLSEQRQLRSVSDVGRKDLQYSLFRLLPSVVELFCGNAVYAGEYKTNDVTIRSLELVNNNFKLRQFVPGVCSVNGVIVANFPNYR